MLVSDVEKCGTARQLPSLGCPSFEMLLRTGVAFTGQSANSSMRLLGELTRVNGDDELL